MKINQADHLSRRCEMVGDEDWISVKPEQGPREGLVNLNVKFSKPVDIGAK